VPVVSPSHLTRPQHAAVYFTALKLSETNFEVNFVTWTWLKNKCIFMYIHSIFLTLYLRIRHELSFIRSFQHFFNAMCKQSHIVWEILSHGWQHLQAYEGLLFFAPCAPCARSAVSSSRMVFKVVSSNGLPLAASWNFTSRRMSKASYEISTSRLFLRSLWHSHWLSGTCWGTGQ